MLDVTGRPVANARVRRVNGRIVITDARGVAVIDSLPLGKQVIDISAIGYEPEQRILDVRAGAGSIPTDTVVLERLESLDTARIVTAGAVGFDARRRGKVGQFITVADIEKELPRNTSALLRKRDGVRFELSPRGVPSILMNGGWKQKTCVPQVLIDGFPAPPAMSSPGHSAIDAAMHLEDIGGVEIYINSAEIPPQFSIWGVDPRSAAIRTCGAIVFWTRPRLALPPAPPSLQKP